MCMSNVMGGEIDGEGGNNKKQGKPEKQTGPMIGLGLGRLRQRLRQRPRLEGGGWKLLKALLDAFN